MGNLTLFSDDGQHFFFPRGEELIFRLAFPPELYHLLPLGLYADILQPQLDLNEACFLEGVHPPMGESFRHFFPRHLPTIDDGPQNRKLLLG